MAEETVEGLLLQLGIDAGGFTSGMRAINDHLKLAQSEFVAAGGKMKDFGSTGTGVEATTKLLTDSIELQKVKIAALTKEYQAAASGGVDTAQAATKLKIELNNATGELKGMESKLGQAKSGLNSLGTEMGQEESKSNSLHNALSNLGTGLGKIGGALGKAAVAGLAAVGTAATAAAAGAVELAKKALESADETQRLADVTGFTAEQIQIMQYQAKAVGVDMETMTGAQGKLTKAMSAAATSIAVTSKDSKKALNTQAQAFKDLGVTVVDSNGHLRDAKDVMNDSFSALAKMTNETERDAMAQKLFGKSALELNPLIKAGGLELAHMADQAMATGAVMSNEAVAGLDNFGDNLNSLKQTMTGIAGTALSALMPALTGLTTMLQGLAVSAQGALKSGDWSGFADQVGTDFGKIVDQVSGMLPVFIDIGTKILTTLVTSLVQAVPIVLPKLTTGLLQLINAIVKLLVDEGPTLIKTAIDAISTLAMGMLAALPQMMTAAIEIILALVQGLTAQLPVLIPAAISAVLTLYQALVANLPMLIDAAIQLILALADGLIAALPQILEAAPKIIKGVIDGLVKALPMLINAAIQIVTKLVDFLLNNLPMLITAAVQIIGAIVIGLIQAIPQLNGAVPKLFTALGDSFKKMDWLSIGKSIIDGIISGIKSMAGGIADAAKNAASGALGAVKSLLGIKSPSSVMRDQVGAQMAAGMAEGISGSAGLVQTSMSALTSRLAGASVNIKGIGVEAAASTPAARAAGGITINIGSVAWHGKDDIRKVLEDAQLYSSQLSYARGG